MNLQSSSRRRAGVAAVVIGLSLALAACGQKAGVETAQPGLVAVDGTSQAPYVDPATGQVVNPAPADGGTGSLDGTGSGSGSGTLPGTSGSGTGTVGDPGAGSDSGTGNDGAGGDGSAPSGGGDATGVTDKTIKIGVHAPVTGAAAIPQRSFENAVGTYFAAVNKKGGIFGRKIEVTFEDDQFRPDIARVKCKEMAEQVKVFLLIGGAGADQIDSCARYAAEEGVPYLSAGVHETRPGQVPLSDLSTYFALSLTYDQQVPLLARLYKSQHNGDKVVVITADNDSLNGYHDKAVSALSSAAGGNLEYEARIPKNTQAEAPSIASRICTSGAEAVIWNASPSTLINVTKLMTCTPTFMGPGLTNGLNIGATASCPTVDGSFFYSPFPGLDVMRKNSEFVRDYQSKNGSAPDDIGAAIYGVERVIVAMLKASGENLTREGFMSTIAKVKSFNTGVYPSTNFKSRFGGTAMHLLQADCGSREYRTVRMNERP